MSSAPPAPGTMLTVCKVQAYAYSIKPGGLTTVVAAHEVVLVLGDVCVVLSDHWKGWFHVLSRRGIVWVHNIDVVLA